MDSVTLRKKFIKYWTSEPRNHKEIPNVSLVPNIDSTLLFVNSGMFPLVPYLSGQPHPLGSRLCNIQKCLRPKYEEILEVGDNRHSIIFEMLGNWSLGDFDKTKQIPWILDLYVSEFGFDPTRIYISVWGGDEDVPKDNIAIQTWQKAFKKYGITAEYSDNIYDIPKNLEEGKQHKFRIFPYGKGKNWWQRGEAPGELGGPSSEMFYDLGKIEREQDQYFINDDSGRFIEFGNNVFMEYFLNKDMVWVPLKQKNIDFGGGLERAAMCIANTTDIFETDLYSPIINTVSTISKINYIEAKNKGLDIKPFRIIADHAKAAAFIIADGVLPANKDQGYVLRRFIRRMARNTKKLNIQTNIGVRLAQSVIDNFAVAYPHLKEHENLILETIEREETNFQKTLNRGLKEISKIKESNNGIDGEKAFYIYETFGIPIEMTLEEFEMAPEEIVKLEAEFKAQQKKHQEESRKGAEQKFKGGLADRSEETIKLHTAHHLLLKALQEIIDPAIHQKGSNITGERLRIDFNYGDNISEDQIRQIEKLVNSRISESLKVERREMKKEDAEKIGAEMEFGQKYPDMVSVYTIYNKDGSVFSMEFCGGPHVKNTKEIGEGGKKFKIIKIEKIGSNMKRIKANLI